MNCFNHKDKPAIGICKSCQKAVCSECAIDTGRGVACCTECEIEVDVINQILDKSKLIYSIGEKPKLLPTGIIMYLFFGIFFTGFGAYQTYKTGEPDIFLFVMGTGFLAIAVLAWFRNRKLNINC